MGKHDPRVDAYIAKAADFAKPVLRQLRKLVHDACPEVEETIKWSFPHFMYRGILCHMAAFKRHCTFWFWHQAGRDLRPIGRITQLADLPTDASLVRAVKKAMKLNASGVKTRPAAKPRIKKTVKPPADFLSALKKSKKALATFERFSYSQKKEYVEWIADAKREETRAKRLTMAVDWLAEGKTRNWKYERK